VEQYCNNTSKGSFYIYLTDDEITLNIPEDAFISLQFITGTSILHNGKLLKKNETILSNHVDIYMPDLYFILYGNNLSIKKLKDNEILIKGTSIKIKIPSN
ncbi:hypothetical protein, partial [Palaeococcus sp. (in: euryarchaeotes)]